MIIVERVTSPENVSLSDINELLPQLHTATANPGDLLGTQTDLDTITSDKDIIFVVAKDEAKVIGMAAGYLIVKFGKKIGYIEEVVVSEAYRGQGIGRKLLELIIEEARKARTKQLYLTSRDGRAAANSLYQKLGFEKRETNNYRLKF
ncbi:GNAT family N-acetyltransferase [Candidatus Kaiserbacteria bacterium]|nr:GNAT family N-acetyltransferase [Candidatus Kaiserbacteria bacterium]